MRSGHSTTELHPLALLVTLFDPRLFNRPAPACESAARGPCRWRPASPRHPCGPARAQSQGGRWNPCRQENKLILYYLENNKATAPFKQKKYFFIFCMSLIRQIYIFNAKEDGIFFKKTIFSIAKHIIMSLQKPRSPGFLLGLSPRLLRLLPGPLPVPPRRLQL